MGGHLAVFAEILSSNQLLWNSLSSLERHSEVVTSVKAYTLHDTMMFTQH